MQRILMAVLPLLVFAAGGCDFFWHKERFYTYCDATGCYTVRSERLRQRRRRADRLDLHGEQRVRAGLLLRPTNGTLHRGRVLRQRQRLSGGMTCDTTRHSCEPSAPPGGNGTDLHARTTTARQATSAIRRRSSACRAGNCTTNADCGAGMVCDSRHTCVPGPTTCTHRQRLRASAATATTARAPRPASARSTRTARTSAPTTPA